MKKILTIVFLLTSFVLLFSLSSCNKDYLNGYNGNGYDFTNDHEIHCAKQTTYECDSINGDGRNVDYRNINISIEDCVNPTVASTTEINPSDLIIKETNGINEIKYYLLTDEIVTNNENIFKITDKDLCKKMMKNDFDNFSNSIYPKTFSKIFDHLFDNTKDLLEVALNEHNIKLVNYKINIENFLKNISFKYDDVDKTPNYFELSMPTTLTGEIEVEYQGKNYSFSFERNEKRFIANFSFFRNEYDYVSYTIKERLNNIIEEFDLKLKSSEANLELTISKKYFTDIEYNFGSYGSYMYVEDYYINNKYRSSKETRQIDELYTKYIYDRSERNNAAYLGLYNYYELNNENDKNEFLTSVRDKYKKAYKWEEIESNTTLFKRGLCFNLSNFIYHYSYKETVDVISGIKYNRSMGLKSGDAIDLREISIIPVIRLGLYADKISEYGTRKKVLDSLAVQDIDVSSLIEIDLYISENCYNDSFFKDNEIDSNLRGNEIPLKQIDTLFMNAPEKQNGYKIPYKGYLINLIVF